MNIPAQLVQELSILGWSIARLTLISHFIIAVIQCRTVNLKTLANVFDTDAKVNSNYKRLQRFFRSFDLDQDSVYLFCY